MGEWRDVDEMCKSLGLQFRTGQTGKGKPPKQKEEEVQEVAKKVLEKARHGGYTVSEDGVKLNTGRLQGLLKEENYADYNVAFVGFNLMRNRHSPGGISGRENVLRQARILDRTYGLIDEILAGKRNVSVLKRVFEDPPTLERVEAALDELEKAEAVSHLEEIRGLEQGGFQKRWFKGLDALGEGSAAYATFNALPGTDAYTDEALWFLERVLTAGEKLPQGAVDKEFANQLSTLEEIEQAVNRLELRAAVAGLDQEVVDQQIFKMSAVLNEAAGGGFLQLVLDHQSEEGKRTVLYLMKRYVALQEAGKGMAAVDAVLGVEDRTIESVDEAIRAVEAQTDAPAGIAWGRVFKRMGLAALVVGLLVGVGLVAYNFEAIKHSIGHHIGGGHGGSGPKEPPVTNPPVHNPPVHNKPPVNTTPPVNHKPPGNGIWGWGQRQA